MRLVRHALGETRIPAAPQRIVVLGYIEVEEMIALGVQPSGILFAPAPHLEEQLEGVPVIGSAEGLPNLEALALLQPDLIFGSPQIQPLYQKLSQIAPTVAIVRGGSADWQHNLRQTALLLGKTAQADALLAAYVARVRAVRASLGEARLMQTEITAFRPYGQVSAFVVWVKAFPNTILNDLGSRTPQAQLDLLPEGRER